MGTTRHITFDNATADHITYNIEMAFKEKQLPLCCILFHYTGLFYTTCKIVHKSDKLIVSEEISKNFCRINLEFLKKNIFITKKSPEDLAVRNFCTLQNGPQN